MVFGKSPGGLPCRFPARRDLDAELRPPDMDQAFGGIAVAQIKGLMEGEANARSGRTRRSSRSSRGWTTENVVQGFRSGLDGNKRAECRVDSVKHSTSPSRRENARRAITSPVFQSQSAATEHPLVRPLRRRVSQSVVFNTFTNSAFPIVASSASVLFPCRIPLVRNALDTRALRREI